MPCLMVGSLTHQGTGQPCEDAAAAACTQHCCPAAQIAKVMGARVVAVCRGDTKAAALRALGADAVVDTAAAGKDVPLRKLIKAWRSSACTSTLALACMACDHVR